MTCKNYVVLFREESDDKVGLVETTVSLPALTVEHQPLYIECDLPAYGVVYKPLQIVYTLYNKTSYVQEFEASMDSCDSFAFSGHKQVFTPYHILVLWAVIPIHQSVKDNF